MTNREITSKMVQMYNVPKSPGADPCQIIVEDHGKSGEVTIKCWTTSATYYWGSAGMDFKTFLTGLDMDYWMGKLFPGSHDSYFDRKETEKKMKEQVINYRKEERITAEEARSLYDYFAKEIEYNSSDGFCQQIMDKDFGIFAERMEHRDSLREMFNPFVDGDMDTVRSADPRVCYIWFNSWLPFIKHLCENELKISYKEPSCSMDLKKQYDRRDAA